MISADAAFEKCANTAAAFFAAQPAYVTYHVHSHAAARGLMKDRPDERIVYLRTADDRAIIIDQTHPKRVVGRPFPVQPMFDPLSKFEIRGQIDSDEGLTKMEVRNVQPMTYVAKPSSADVVVLRVGDYTPAYGAHADDPATPLHIHLTPTPALWKSEPHLWLRDLYIDRVRWLPTRVIFNGRDNLVMTIDYTPLDAYWVVSHFSVSVSGRLLFFSGTANGDATLDGYFFSNTAPFDFDLATPTPETK